MKQRYTLAATAAVLAFAGAGDKITIGWVDNKGDKRSDEATVS